MIKPSNQKPVVIITQAPILLLFLLLTTTISQNPQPAPKQPSAPTPTPTSSPTPEPPTKPAKPTKDPHQHFSNFPHRFNLFLNSTPDKFGMLYDLTNVSQIKIAKGKVRRYAAMECLELEEIVVSLSDQVWSQATLQIQQQFKDFRHIRPIYFNPNPPQSSNPTPKPNTQPNTQSNTPSQKITTVPTKQPRSYYPKLNIPKQSKSRVYFMIDHTIQLSCKQLQQRFLFWRSKSVGDLAPLVSEVVSSYGIDLWKSSYIYYPYTNHYIQPNITNTNTTNTINATNPKPKQDKKQQISVNNQIYSIAELNTAWVPRFYIQLYHNLRNRINQIGRIRKVIDQKPVCQAVGLNFIVYYFFPNFHTTITNNTRRQSPKPKKLDQQSYMNNQNIEQCLSFFTQISTLNPIKHVYANPVPSDKRFSSQINSYLAYQTRQELLQEMLKPDVEELRRRVEVLEGLVARTGRDRVERRERLENLGEVRGSGWFWVNYGVGVAVVVLLIGAMLYILYILTTNLIHRITLNNQTSPQVLYDQPKDQNTLFL